MESIHHARGGEGNKTMDTRMKKRGQNNGCKDTINVYKLMDILRIKYIKYN